MSREPEDPVHFPLLIGRTLSHYEVLAKLGQGGMGEVYLARDVELQRQVALKVLPRELSQDPERLQRLRREARTLAALDHPNIVPLYSFETHGDEHFLTMAYVEGESLDGSIPDGGLPLERVLDLAVALTDALRAAHQQGIVHRDLKPANVMVDREGRPRVLDFGLAKRDPGSLGDLSRLETLGFTEQMTREGVILGTFPYMSPEQAEGRPVDTRSDLFSFGVMLYEMTCGQRPFQGETGLSLISAILRDEPRPIRENKPGLPVRLDEILSRCLAKDPKERYPSAEALRDDLLDLQSNVARGTAAPALSDEVPVTAPRTPRASPRLSTPTRRRSSWLAGAGVVLTIAALATWQPWAGTEEVRTLAVVPFASPETAEIEEYLPTGVAESLIRQIGQLPSVRVAPLDAVLQLANRAPDPREVGRLLGVETVLTGTVGPDEIEAWLWDADSGALLWSDRYDRASHPLLDVQDQIAAHILDEGLRLELTGSERRAVGRPPTADGEAYDLFLQARYLQRRATEQDYLEAVQLLERAVVRDPEFTRAYLVLAGIHAALVIDGYVRPTDGWALASRYLHRAEALDPEHPDGHAIRHAMAFFFAWDWEGAARERRLAMQLPIGAFDPDLLRTYSLELLALGRPEEALEMARRSRELDPLSIGLAMLEADYLLHAGRPEAAIAVYERAIEVEPDNPEQYFGLAEALVGLERWDEAIEARRRAHDIAGDETLEGRFARARGEEGYREADRAWIGVQLAWLEARSAWGYVSPLDFARAYAQLEETERAFEYLDRAFMDRSPMLVFLNVDRAWDPIRHDARIGAAVRRVGLPKAP